MKFHNCHHVVNSLIKQNFFTVMCSWVAFWIVKTDAPARCGLGITTILSVTKIGFGGGKGKPQVGYPTAMDVFVIICLMSVFAALCEFVVMNFISVTMTRLKVQCPQCWNFRHKIGKYLSSKFETFLYPASYLSNFIMYMAIH